MKNPTSRVCYLQTLCNFALANSTRGVAQLVSAPRSGRGGRKFESSHPDTTQATNRQQPFVACVIFMKLNSRGLLVKNIP